LVYFALPALQYAAFDTGRWRRQENACLCYTCKQSPLTVNGSQTSLTELKGKVVAKNGKIWILGCLSCRLQ